MLNVKTGTVLDRLLNEKKFYFLEYSYSEVEEVKARDQSFLRKCTEMERLYNNMYGFLYALKEMNVITVGELDTAIKYLIEYVKA